MLHAQTKEKPGDHRIQSGFPRTQADADASRLDAEMQRVDAVPSLAGPPAPGPAAFGMQLAVTAPLDRNKLNVMFSAALAEVATASAKPIANSAQYVFIDFLLF